MLHKFIHNTTVINVQRIPDGAGSFEESITEQASTGYFAVLSTEEVIKNQQRGIDAEAVYFTLSDMSIDDRLRYEGVIYNVVSVSNVVSPYTGVNYKYYGLKRIVWY